MSFYRATDTPILDIWWHLPWVSKPELAALFILLFRHAFYEILFWYNNCQNVHGQHDGWSLSPTCVSQQM